MPCVPLTRRSYYTVANGFESPEDFEINVVAGVTNHAEKEEENCEKITSGSEDQILVYGYCRNIILTILTWILIVCTGGLLRLVFHWAPHWMLMATHVRCPLRRAQKLLITETYQKHVGYRVKEVKELTAESAVDETDGLPLIDVRPDYGAISDSSTLAIHTGQGVFKEFRSIRMFTYKKLRYIWDDDLRQFKKLPGLDTNVTTAALHNQTGLNVRQQMLRRVIYGTNDIPVPVTSVLTLLCLEVLNPFYIFQLFSFCLWFSDEYYYYAVAILLLSIFGITASIIQTRRNQKKLQRTVHSVDVVTVVRGDSKKHESITTDLLVPGDILIVPPHGCIMHCDAVLITGNCIVNESMLTGESVPVTKTPLPNTSEVYDVKEHARHTLFCGTQVIQTRYYGEQHVYALVLRTGFSTSKGNLVRSIMYPPPVDFKFEQDSYRFVELLGLVASIGFIYTVVTKHLRGVDASEIAIESLDLITIVVPPALPAAMTVGRMYAQIRLKLNGIYCISPRSINVSGSVDCVCFDKTGTLTEDGLDMWGVVPIADAESQPPVRLLSQMEHCHLFYGLVTCHSLTIIEGKLSGDPLDLKMFESTEWLLEEPDVNDNSKFDLVFPTIVKPKNAPSDSQVLEIGIVRQFPFSSALQRMSVITKTLEDKEFMVYCKGSPEMILSLSKPETVPPDFNRTLEEYTEEGYRVLALAYKPLEKLSYPKVQRMQREDAEQDLIMLGLVVLENKLKPETRGIIKELRQANIGTIMVTGDNMLTAVSVARDCGIVPWGKRVVTVHCDVGVGATPTLSFSNHSSPFHISVSYGGDFSQATNSTSVGSLDTLETGSVVTDLEFSPSHASRTVAAVGSEYVFAVTGNTWEILRKSHPELVPKIVTRGAVFARMSPDQKQDLIQELQALGYFVAMCGDGANDCGALKAAHTGISLSDAESSVASPFTSKQANISCVPLVVREGRAALVTSFGIFKYMAAYSLTQFISVMILYSIESNLTDIEFLFIDLFIITSIAFFFGRTGSYKGELSRIPPLTSLVSLAPILSLVFHVLIIIAVQAVAFTSVQNQDWYLPSLEARNKTDLEFSPVASYENYAVFSVSSFQYIILAFVFSKGPPYRMPFYSNYGLIISMLVLTVFCVYLVIYPAPFLVSLFQLAVPPDMTYRCTLLAYPLVHFVLAYLIEHFLIDFLVAKKIRPKFHNIQKSKKKYLSIEHKMRTDSSWPVIASPETKCWTKKETRNVPSSVMLSPGSLLTQTSKALTNGNARISDLEKSATALS